MFFVTKTSESAHWKGAHTTDPEAFIFLGIQPIQATGDKGRHCSKMKSVYVFRMQQIQDCFSLRSLSTRKNIPHINPKNKVHPSPDIYLRFIFWDSIQDASCLFLKTAWWCMALNTTTPRSHLKGNGLCVLQTKLWSELCTNRKKEQQLHQFGF